MREAAAVCACVKQIVNTNAEKLPQQVSHAMMRSLGDLVG